MTIRDPAVDDRFYPGDPTTLSQTLEELIPHHAEKKEALAVISPHAGYIFSGKVAGETFARIEIPKDIIVLGPNHYGRGAPVAMMAEGYYKMPLGNIPINSELASIVDTSGIIEADETAHQLEHSLEVQLPFIQYIRHDFCLLPFVISQLTYSSCVEVGKELARVIKEYGKPVLLVASTDMTHFESRESATAKDQQVIKHIEDLDPEALYDTVIRQGITMCGIMPTTITLVAALALGARQAELVRYSDSAVTTGDTSQVVGYAGFVVS
ncbi:MAG: AmmeMemoRadiSam system protein B [Desulfurivibrionaceae bacterium]